MKTRSPCRGTFSAFLFRAFDKLGDYLGLRPSPEYRPRTHRLGELQKLEDRRLLSVLPGPDLLVSSPTRPLPGPPAYFSGHALASNPSTGDFVVAWMGPQSTPGNAVFAQKYNAAGTPQGTTLLVSPAFGGGNQQNPSVAMNANGDFVVVWADQPSGSHWNTYARAYKAAETALSGPVLIASSPGGDQQDPTVALSPGGTYVVTWAGNQSGHWQAYAASLQLNGTPQLAPFLVHGAPTFDQVDAHVAMDPGGSFVITWSCNQLGAWNIYGEQFDANGISHGFLTVTNTILTPGEGSSAVAMDNAGDFVITWANDQPGPAGWQIYAEQFSAHGMGNGPFLVNSVAADSQEFPSVALAGQGNFTIAWTSNKQDGNGWGIFGRDYNKQGTPLESSEYQVNTYTAGDQVFPSVAVDNYGDQAFSWFSPTESGGGTSVYAKVNVGPAVIATPAAITTTQAGATASFNVALTAQPTSTVTIALTPSAAGQGSLSQSVLIFNSSNWNTAQTVTVTGLDNPLTSGNQTYVINGSGVSGDSAYNGLAMNPVTVTNNTATGSPHTLIVNTTADDADGNTTSIANLEASPGTDGTISLREAILAANNTPGINQIFFSIGSGPQTIQLFSPLPVITNLVIIDGTSQPGYSGQPLIEVNGAQAGASANGLQISAGNSTIRGLIIDGFSGDAIELLTRGNNVIAGNYLGTNSTGTAATPNGGQGILVLNSPNNLIGGSGPFDGNLISGNASSGVVLHGSTTTGNVLEGNHLGTDASGTAALGNVGDGVTIATGASNNTIGGTNPGEGNVIAYNSGAGVAVLAGSGNAIRGDSIFNNNLGIDLAPRGVNPNTANSPQNHPVLTAVEGSPSTVTISGTLSSVPSSTIVVDFYASGSADPSGHVEGASYLGSTTVTTDAGGNASFQSTFTAAVPANTLITATAIVAGRNTSEFSAALPVLEAGITVRPSTPLITSETGTTATFSVSLNAQPAASVTISLTVGDPTQGSLSTTSLTFDASNWMTPQTITVTGLDDHLINGSQSYQITGSVNSSDADYNNLSVTPVSVTNTEADVAGLQVTTTALTTSESGTSTRFGVALTAEPGSSVTVNLTTTVSGQGSLSTSSLTFDNTNWNTFQFVTITGLDDHLVNGNQTYQITGASSSGDNNFKNLAMPAINVTNTEADVAGIQVSTTSLTTSETGTSAGFTVTLTSEPVFPVTINLGMSRSGQGSLSVSSLNFDSRDWNTPQRVVVTGLDDHIVNGNQTYQITGTATSSDSNYNLRPLPVLTVTNLEADVAGITPAVLNPPPSSAPTSTTRSTAAQVFAALAQVPSNGSPTATPGSSEPGSSGPSRHDDSSSAVLSFVMSHKSETGVAAVPSATAGTGAGRGTSGNPFFVSVASSVSGNDLPARMAPAAPMPVSPPAEEGGEQNQLAGSGEPGMRGPAPVSLAASVSFWDSLTDQVPEEIRTSELISEIGPLTLTGLIATSGYVLLNTRAGYWILSLLTSRPLWHQFDPLEVLFAWEKEAKPAEDPEDQETLLSLVE